MILTAGVTTTAEGHDRIVWHILGQTYVPKLVSDRTFLWHATLPAESFVPPHIHPTQDEWITVQTGSLEVEFGAEVLAAGPGDVIRLPMGIAHGIFNRSGATATCMFGVAPTRRLFDLFNAIHNVADPADVVRISAEHEVEFLPPPS
ncbi:MAG: cupin domain-containing protein [Pseudomonadota bacterium]